MTLLKRKSIEAVASRRPAHTATEYPFPAAAACAAVTIRSAGISPTT